MNIENKRHRELSHLPDLLEPFAPGLSLIHQAAVQSGIDTLAFGGTTAEMLANLYTLDEYVDTQNQLKNLFEKMPVYENLTGAIELLTNHHGPDLDIYAKNQQQLDNLYEHLLPLMGHDHSVITNDNAQVSVTYAPVYAGGVNRMTLDIKKINSDHQTHIDITPQSEWGNEAAINKRIDPAMHSLRGIIHFDNQLPTFTINNNTLPQDINQPLNLELTKKDKRGLLVLSVRNLRKLFFARTSVNNQDHWQDSTIQQFADHISLQDTFELKEITSLPQPEWENHLASLSDYQRHSAKAQILLMAQKDPIMTLVILQDTGLDRLLFERHLSHQEYITILQSPYVTYVQNNEEQTGSRLSQVNTSRLAYLNRPHDGLTRFIQSIGYTFGVKQQFEVHMEWGLEILNNPELISRPDQTLSIQSQEYDPLILHLKNGGLVTETELHRRSLPHLSQEDFRRHFLELKKQGVVDTVRRNYQNQTIRFYSLKDINLPLPLTEVASLLPQTLKSAVVALVARGITSFESLFSLNPLDWPLLFEDSSYPDYETGQQLITALLGHKEQQQKNLLLQQHLTKDDLEALDSSL
jgi:hypothetical protein